MVPWRFRAWVRTRTWVWSRRRRRARSSRRMRTGAGARPWMISPRTPSLAWTPASPVSSGIEEAQNWIHSKNKYGNSVASWWEHKKWSTANHNKTLKETTKNNQWTKSDINITNQSWSWERSSRLPTVISGNDIMSVTLGTDGYMFLLLCHYRIII